MVELVRKRHETYIEMMTDFFTKLSSDSDRWDYVESYFAGMPYQAKAGGNSDSNVQIVKHEKFEKGIIEDIKDGKVIVQFQGMTELKKFIYPDAFEKNNYKNLTNIQ